MANWAHCKSKQGIVRLVEIGIGILIMCFTGISLGGRWWGFLLLVCLFAAVIGLVVFLFLRICGKSCDQPEFIFLICACIVFAIIGIITIFAGCNFDTEHGVWWFIVGGLCIANVVLIIIDILWLKGKCANCSNCCGGGSSSGGGGGTGKSGKSSSDGKSKK